MKHVTGDLIRLAEEGHFDVIVHGCNCHCTMGRGIALQIKNQYPQALEADLNTKKGDASKLGSYTVADSGEGFLILNAYTQYDYYGKTLLVSYHALRECFRKIKQEFGHLRIGYPKIGAGLAGGNWNVIADIIDEELQGSDHTLVLWDKA